MLLTVKSLSRLSLNKTAAAISLTEHGLFDLACGVTGNVSKDNLTGTLLSLIHV